MFNNVLKILSGTVLAQLLIVLSTPFLTRLYDPSVFGQFAAFLGVLGVISVIASYRYELAISETKKDYIAVLAVKLSLILCGANAAIILLFICIIYIGGFFSGGIYYILPFSFLINGFYQTILIFTLRGKFFNLIACIKLLQAFLLVFSQLILFSYGEFGLVLGHLLSILISLLVIIYLLRKEDFNNKKITTKRFVYLIRRFFNYFKYSSAAAFINALGMHLPVFILSVFFTPVAAGFYSVATRMLLTPANLLTNAISKVLLSDAKEFINPKYVNQVFNSNITLQIQIIFIPLFVISTSDEKVLVMLFGSEWGGVASLLQIIAPWVFISFISNPCLIVYETTGQQKKVLFFQITLLLLRLLSFIVGYALESEAVAIKAFAYSSGFCWLFFFLIFTSDYKLGGKWIVLALFTGFLFVSILELQCSSLIVLMLIYPFFIYKSYKRVKSV